MALKTILSSDLCTSDVSYQIANPSDRDLISSLIYFLQKHHLNETQAAFLRELSLIEKAQITLEELEQAIFKRDFKISKDARSLHNGNFFPLPMETEESNKKTQIVQPQTIVFQSTDKPVVSDSIEISMPSPMRNLDTPHTSFQEPLVASKLNSSPPISESDPAFSSAAANVPSPSPVSTPSYQVPIVLNSLAAANQANNIVTLLQTNQSIPNPTSQQTQILLDVGTNSIGNIQQLGTPGLNGVIPIQLNLSPSQPAQQSQQQPQVMFNSQQLQLINSGSKPPLYRPTQTQISVPSNQVPIILSHSGDPPNNLASVTGSPKIVPRMVDQAGSGQNGTPPLTIQVQYQQPVSAHTKPPIATPVIQQTRVEQEPQLVQKEGAQITLSSNSHPILSYPQFQSPLTQTPKTVMTSNGLCQVENFQITHNGWLKEAPSDVHAIPIINTTPLATHFGLDPSFELGQRRRKKRAVFAPHARRALEQSFEQNSRPSRRELEYLAVKLGLLFEEVRVWFCNKRQKERQQMQMNEPQCDTPSDSYNSIIDCISPPAFQPSQAMEDEPAKILELRIKEECESPGRLVLAPGVSDSSQPLPKEILMSDSYETQYKARSSESSISALVQDSLA